MDERAEEAFFGDKLVAAHQGGDEDAGDGGPESLVEDAQEQAGGALAGDAGEGAAIGALASTVFGALSRSSRPSEPPRTQQQTSNAEYQYYQQQQAAANKSEVVSEARRIVTVKRKFP